MGASVRCIQPAPHEYDANHLYNKSGLNPYFAADRRIKDGDGSQVGYFEIDGEQWVTKLYFSDSNIVHPGEKLPTGTEWRIETIREYHLKVARHPEEDYIGEQSFVAHIAPRWQGMKGKTNSGDVREISVPEAIEEAVNVRVQGSNIKYERYHALLERGAESVGVRGDYFRYEVEDGELVNPHPYSNVLDAEMYGRLNKKRSGPIHARDGPIAALGHYLEHDRTGYRKIVQNDDDGHGNNLPGYYHTVTLDPSRIKEAWPHHDLPKEIKHYYAREAYKKPKDDPLAHPKLGASYQRSRWNGKIGVSLDELAQLREELTETVLSVLAESGIPIAPPEDGHGPFVEDAYFSVETVERESEPLTLDLTTVHSEQESVVVRTLADGLSPVQWESIQTLVADGGEISPKDIADDHGRHVESVRRALRKMEELVDRKYGQVRLRSPFIAEQVHTAIKEAKDATRRAVETSAKAIHAAERGLDEDTSAFMAWASRYGVDVNAKDDARMVLRFGYSQDAGALDRLLTTGYQIWTGANMDPARFREAKVHIDGQETTAWRWL